MKNIIIIFTIFFILHTYYSFAEENTQEEKQIDQLYLNYKENIKNNCLNKEFYNPSKFIYKYKDKDYQKYYPDVKTLVEKEGGLSKNKIGVGLDIIKNKYRFIQNEIYKCGVISAQYKGIQLILKEANLDKEGKLKSFVDGKYKPLLSKLKAQFINCKLENKNIKLTKKNILDQSTFELCKYSHYLDYLYLYYNNFENLLGIKNVNENMKYDPNVIYSLNTNIKQDIVDEKKHSYETFKTAFTAYREYQSYYPIHLSLELLKTNLILYREKLYKALNPINQVVYKIINAMSK